MPEIRKDPITKSWVIISTEREGRPSDYVLKEEIAENFFCPFCPGNEEHTTKPVKSYYDENGNWIARVVPNKYPVLVNDRGAMHKKDSLFESMAGVGEHEIIIESNKHDFNLFNADEDEIFRIFSLARERLTELASHRNIIYTLYFKNYKNAAGATLSHPHSQIIATPMVPKRVREELDNSKEYYMETGKCIFCEMLKEEKERKERVIYENEHFIAFCPYASKLSFEVFLLPKEHLSDFHFISDKALKSFSKAIQFIFSKLNAVLGDVPYNYVLHNSPYGDEGEAAVKYYHWHFELLPKLSKLAGFEWGSGYYINSFSPEKAAEKLRET